ncbi:MAG: radical SAM family heme chaperone HemW, partial [Pseudomonadota bacterium]
MNGEPLALYMHWPFCLAKCPYCDFNSHVRDQINVKRWHDALLTDLSHVAGRTGRRPLSSIFFGGGTPSLMAPETVAAVIEAARSHWVADEGLEVTLEANPTSVEAGRLAAFAEAGINRVSLGVQALNDDDLAALGRQHSAADALAAVGLARGLFDEVSFDLIYARPGQTVEAWRRELSAALDHSGHHLSVYQLTIEPGTKFESLYRQGALTIPDEDVQADLYEATQEMLADAGRPAYEISNHAKPGHECRHNLTYWRYGDYAGVGPGAHGRLSIPNGRVGTRAHRAPEIWLERVEANGHGNHPDEPIGDEQAAEEALLMGLRLVEGINEARWRASIGRPFETVVNSEALDRLIDGGFLEH